MKLLLVLAAVTALCAGSAIPLVPGDNSHYVEGESRYIWMPDGEGVPHLIDLQAPIEPAMLTELSRDGANNQYWLFTRDNPLTPQVIVHNDADTIWNSNYVGSRSLKVIVHGWNSNGWTEMNPLITAAFLAVEDCNVIVVDWNELANNILYPIVVLGVPGVGQYLGNFLAWLIDTAGGDWNNTHLVGFSLGAHVVGNAGRTVNSAISRISGLDPAGPQFGGNSNALSSSDGQYVESIHTDGGVLGIFDSISHADFYPNGGRAYQPGCWTNICSHGRAPELFAASVQFNNFTGRQCTDISQVSDPSSCTGSVLMMGNSIINKRGSGIYALTTGSTWPF